jgi:hypothetical protein
MLRHARPSRCQFILAATVVLILPTFVFCQIQNGQFNGVIEGVRSYALDPKNAEAFWKKSEEMVGELLLKR